MPILGIGGSLRSFLFTSHLSMCIAEAYEGDQLRQLVAALCPTIYGHELVKAGLLLSLFGGVRKHGSSNNRVRILDIRTYV
jgi:DNA replicative helicase MCM subunit Mcm2 (Cdc46/Mcm family)